MKRKSKILPVALALTCTLSLVACGDKIVPKDTIVTKEEWENAIHFNFTNYEYSEVFFYQTDNTQTTAILRVDEDIAYQKTTYPHGLVTEYYYSTVKIHGGGLYYKHSKVEGVWKKRIVIEADYYKSAFIFISNFHYEDFTYDTATGTYQATDIVFDEDSSFTDITIAFLENRISSIHYTINEVQVSCSANYDCVDVTLYNQS